MHGITYAQLWKSIVFHARKSLAFHLQDGLAEWSKALASGASPQGRGFEPHSRHMKYEYLSKKAYAAHFLQITFVAIDKPLEHSGSSAVGSA